MRPALHWHTIYILRKLLLAFLLFASFGALVPKAHSQQLKIGIPLLEPYATRSEEGVLTGVYPEISRKIAAAADVEIQLEASPLARMWLQFSRGQYDIMYALPSKEHGRHGRHLANLFDLQIIAVARKDVNVCRISDLKDSIVGTLRRVAYRPRPDQVPANNLRSANSYDQLVRMLSVARIDAIIGTDLSIIHLFQKYDLKPDDLSAPHIIKPVPVYAYGYKKSPHQKDIDAFGREARLFIHAGGVRNTILSHVPEYAYAHRPTTCEPN